MAEYYSSLQQCGMGGQGVSKTYYFEKNGMSGMRREGLRCTPDDFFFFFAV